MYSQNTAQDVMRCDLCETAVVEIHCDICTVNLCKACLGEHFSADFSKTHKIVDFKDRKSTPLYPKCLTHDKERCQLYCEQCDIPLCTKCISTDQHIGHKLSYMLQLVNRKRYKFIQELTELYDIIYPTYQDIASSVGDRMSQLEKEYGDLSTAITKHGEDWHREIDKLVQKLKAEVDEMKNTQLQTLQKHLDEINKTMSNIKDEINSLEDAVESNDISKLFNIKFNVEQYSQLPPKIVLTLPRFAPQRIQGENVDLFGNLSSSSITSDEHGYSMKTIQKSPEAGSSPPVKQLLDEPEIVTIIDAKYKYYIDNVACLNEEEIWTSGDISVMKLFSINQGSILKSITTKSSFSQAHIAVNQSGGLLYTDHRDRTVNIVKNKDIEEVIRLENWRINGVCSSFSGDLLVIMYSDDDNQSKLVRYSKSTEKQSIQFDDDGKPLYSCGPSNKDINENKNLDITVADWGAKRVVVVNKAGKLRFMYTGNTPAPKNKPFFPRGITTDSQSHILTIDYYNDCIHIIDQDGVFLRYLNCRLIDPHGLCTDTNDNLFIAECRNKQVKKIKYQK